MSYYVPLFSSEQVRMLEDDGNTSSGVPENGLMQRAGAIAWRELIQHWPQARRIGVACGPGNNGGDGLVLARRARAAGFQVYVVQLPGGEPRKESARHALADWKKAGGEVQVFEGALPTVDIWVDALFGIGLARAPEGASKHLIQALNGSGIEIFALDVPSGVNADTGHVPGVAIRATRTLGFLVDKRGLHTGAALDHVGILHTDALGVPKAKIAACGHAARIVQPVMLASRQRPRKRDSNKGDFGHLLCVGGDLGTGGAIALTAEAALRSGAGMVSVATRAEHVAMLLTRRPELMARGIEESTDFSAMCERAGVLAVGPGLGKGEWGRALLKATLAAGKSMVLDADALNLIAESPRHLSDAIITPHPGEAGRLLGIPAEQVQADRFGAAQALVARYDCCVVLKGAGSIVASPGAVPTVISAGNPGMASGGMGDVLTGVIGSLRAQHLSAPKAAVCGALMHSLAGDAAAKSEGPFGLLASDLFVFLRQLANSSR